MRKLDYSGAWAAKVQSLNDHAWNANRSMNLLFLVKIHGLHDIINMASGCMTSILLFI